MTPIDAHRASLAATPPLAERISLAKIGPYRGYAEVIGELAEQAGDRAREIGKSALGVPIFAFEIVPPGPVLDELTFCMAGIHAMEWIGVETCVELVRRFVITPPARRIVLVPIVNVDGYRTAENDLEHGIRRFRRPNANGVDLNRNWPTHHRVRHLPSKLFPWLGNAGRAPRSEPEVDAVCRLLDDIKAEGREIDRALSLHSFGRMILLPWGHRFRPPERAKELAAAAAQVQARMSERYHVRQVSRWYPGFSFANGMELDHFHAEYGAVSLLVECSNGGLSPLDPGSWTHPFRWFNPRRMRETVVGIADAIEPFLRGD